MSEYNISPTAGSALGVKRSDETRQRMSKALSGDKHLQFELKGEKFHNFGRIHDLAY